MSPNPKKESKRQRLFYRFLTSLCKLNPIEFYGVAKILDVNVAGLQESTEAILSEAIDAFIKLGLPMQKTIVHILEEIVKGQDEETQEVEVEQYGKISKNV